MKTQSPPPGDTESPQAEPFRIEALYHTFWGFVAAASVLLFFASIGSDEIAQRNSIAIGLLAPFVIASIVLNRRGQGYLARVLLIYPLAPLLAAISFVTGGLAARTFTSLELLIIAAGLLLGKRHALAFTLLTMLAGAILWVAELTGALPVDPLSAETLLVRGMMQLFNIVLAAGLIYTALHGLESLEARRTEHRRALEASNRRLQHEIEERKRVEAALRRNQERYERAVQAGRAGVWDWDVKTNDIYLDPILKQMLGYEDHEIRNHLDDWLTHVAEADLGMVRAEIEAVLSGEKERFDLTHRMTHRDGSIRWVETHGVPLRDAEGNIERIVGADTDITERMAATQQVRYQANLLDRVSDAVISTNTEFRILSWNKGAERMYGWQAEEAIGRSVNELLQSEFIDASLESMLAEVAENGRWQGELIQQTKRGAKIEVLSAVGLMNDSQGVPLGAVAVNRDISERKRTQQALAESENRYRSMIEQSPFSIIVYDADGRPMLTNEAHTQLWGISQEETQFILDHYNILEDPELEANGILDGVRRAFAGEATSLPLNRYDSAESQLAGQVTPVVRWVQSYAYPIKDQDGNVREVVIMHEDVTERIESQVQREQLIQQVQQLRRLEALGTLASGVAHDFNNLLFAMLGNADLAQAKLTPDHPASPHLDNITQAGQHARTLIKNILAFSRQAPSDRKPVEMTTLLAETLQLIETSLPPTVEIRAESRAPGSMVMADEAQMHQVIMNLCTNAAHAMPAGGQLTLTFEDINIGAEHKVHTATLAPGRYVRLSVQDSGVGMDETTLERMFEPFFTTKEVDQGTGLGLSVVHGIVADHGGGIDVYSTPGVGTLFEVYLPRLTPEARLAEAGVS